MQNVLLNKMHLKMSSTKWRPFGSDFNVYSVKINNLVDNKFLPVSPIRISNLVPLLHNRSASSCRPNGYASNACEGSTYSDQTRLSSPGLVPMWNHWPITAGKYHGDNITRKQFPAFLTLVSTSIGYRWIPIAWGQSDKEIWWFICG